MKHKDDTVASNVNGVSFLFKKNKVETFVGHGTILGTGKVEVTAGDGARQTLETKAICIATGSEVAKLPGGRGPTRRPLGSCVQEMRKAWGW